MIVILISMKTEFIADISKYLSNQEELQKERRRMEKMRDCSVSKDEEEEKNNIGLKCLDVQPCD